MRTSILSVLILTLVAAFVRADAPSATQISAAAEAYAKAINSNDADTAATFLNTDAIVDTSIKDVKAPKEFLDGFSGQMKKEGLKAFAMQLCAQKGSTGGMKFLRVVQRGTETRAMIRFVGEGGLNYHEYVVEIKDGKACFVDMYIWLTGEKISSTFGRLAQQAYDSFANSGKIGARLGAVKEMGRAIQEQRWKDVLDAYEKLDPETRKEKLIQIFRIKACFNTNDAAYSAALKEYAELFKDDASLDLMLLDTLLTQKQYDEAFKSLDRLDKAVGGDNYLNVLRANVNFAKGDSANCKVCANKALAAEPNLLPAADTLLTLALEEKDFPAAKAMMIRMEKDMEFEFGDLTKVEPFAGFVASPSYKEWLSERPKR